MSHSLEDATGSAGTWQGAGALIFNRSGQVLLVRQNYGGEYYALLGGAIEAGETPHEAAIREVRKEAGVAIRVDRLIGLYTAPSRGCWLAFVFRGVIERGQPVLPDTGEIAEVGWFDTDRLPEPLYDSARWAIVDALHGEYGVLRDIAVFD